MSQQTEDLYPPELSQYSTAGTASANSPVGQLYRDRELEVELTKLRIQEVEKREELERMIQQRTKFDRDEHERKTVGDLNKLLIGTPAFIHATERQTDLPRREIQRFAGSPKSYWSFSKAFESGLENRTNDNQARLDYLIQYCDGPAKALSQHCTILEQDRSYLVARGLLSKRFGQNHMVAKAHTNGLLDDLRPSDNNSAALVQLAQQITVCEVTLRQLNYDSDFTSSRASETTVQRLPPELHFRWADEATIITRSNR
ncbi:hypothetical protein PHET_06343 [Paragonimus heterotremus]|uniref:Uncharacterized protein n=1 Tax=Paragonimus heterotremus TaxID=100268 RepID=A0A8J4WYL3_9TREM|nr:hypothetical protein PHET_06343 [Paragonimus heterotremus]